MRMLASDKDEQILAQTHLHIISILPIWLGSLLLLLISFAASFSVAYWRDAATKVLPLSIWMGLILLVAALAVLIAGLSLLIYWRNKIIVTDRYLTQLVQQGLFSTTTLQLGHENIQDIRVSKKGFWPTVLGYGEVMVDTAGEERNYILKYMPHPEKLAAVIMQAREDYLKRLA